MKISRAPKRSEAAKQSGGASVPASRITRNEDGLATLVFLTLLLIMTLLATAASMALVQMHHEVRHLEQQQIQRLNMTQTNSAPLALLKIAQPFRAGTSVQNDKKSLQGRQKCPPSRIYLPPTMVAGSATPTVACMDALALNLPTTHQK